MIGDAIRKTKCFDIVNSMIQIECSECSHKETWERGRLRLPPLVVAKHFRNRGWDVDPDGKHAECPNCILKKRNKNVIEMVKKTGEATADNGIRFTTKRPEPSTPTQIEPQMKHEQPKVLRDITQIPDNQDKIAAYLDFAIKNGSYIEGWSDEKIASRIGRSTAYVANIRRALGYTFERGLESSNARDEGLILKKIKSVIKDDTYITGWSDELIAKEFVVGVEYIKSLRRANGIRFKRGRAAGKPTSGFETKILDLLTKVIDGDHYIDGWNDKRVADEVGCSIVYVGDVRRNVGIAFKRRFARSEASAPASIQPTQLPVQYPLVPVATKEEIVEKIVEKSARSDVDPIIKSMIERIPAAGEKWTAADRKDWLAMMESALSFVYKD